MKRLFAHPVTCVAVGVALGYMFSSKVAVIPVVNKLPQF